MNVWLHRISHPHHKRFQCQLLGDHHLLSTGWSDFGVCPEFHKEVCLNKSQDRQDCFERYFKEWGFPKNRWNLWRFIVDMKKGDRVVVPCWRVFSVYEIEDNGVLPVSGIAASVSGTFALNDNGFLCLPNDDKSDDAIAIDLGFFRKVRPLGVRVPRRTYADEDLTAQLRNRHTTVCMTDLAQNVEEALAAFRQNLN